MAVAAIAYAQSGNLRQARALADEPDRNYPDHTLLNFAWLPMIDAIVDIKQNNPSRAIETLQKATSVELGRPVMLVINGLISGPRIPVEGRTCCQIGGVTLQQSLGRFLTIRAS